jgi:DNA-binding winged helix-turn-helix (wHTH) protein/Flp pilus assembly protein TadD
VSQEYRFGPFTFDATRRRLSRDGEIVLVPPKALDVLQVLIENRGRTVNKDDIIDRVWPNTAVEESNLTQSVFMLRRALADEPTDPRYISTVARRGYRFVGDASCAEPDAAPADRRRVHRTTSLAAYHAYVKGRHYWSKRDVENVRAAMAFFRQAIDHDPTYALAYVGLAEAFFTLWVHGWTTAPDAIVTAQAAATRALEIDDAMAEAHATLGAIRMMSARDWPGAERSFCQAIELAPEYPTTRNWFANFLAAQQRFDESVREAQQAVALDPLNATWRMGVGHMLFLGHRYKEALEAGLRALEMDPNLWLAHWVIGMAHEQLGDVSRAAAALREADELSGGNPMVRGVLGRALALCGRTVDARAVLQDLTARHALNAAPAESLALVHAGLGDLDAAFAWFDRAARQGGYLLSFLNVSPLFGSLRSDSRFGTLQRLVGLGLESRAPGP